LSKFQVVVYLAVVYDRVSILIVEGLFGLLGEIEDLESSVSEQYGTVVGSPVIAAVGSAMCDGIGHPLQITDLVLLWIRLEDSGEAAHKWRLWIRWIRDRIG
jgi:hypothetical protein